MFGCCRKFYTTIINHPIEKMDSNAIVCGVNSKICCSMEIAIMMPMCSFKFGAFFNTYIKNCQMIWGTCTDYGNCDDRI